MKKKHIYLSWCNKFHCPGGDCGLTCCTSDWRIPLTDYEIAKYTSLNHPFRDELVNSIDLAKKEMKCDNGKCNLLDENQYCKLVINCGVDALSFTCSSFPWKVQDYGAVSENAVEMVCPLVAEYLFDDEKIYFETRKLEPVGNINTDLTEYPDYINLTKIKMRLMDMLQQNSGTHIYGKLFLMLKVYDATCKTIRAGEFDANKADELIEAFLTQEIIDKTFSQCEVLKSGLEYRKTSIYSYFTDLLRKGGEVCFRHLYKHRPYMKSTIELWNNDAQVFYNDMTSYVNAIGAQYPFFLEKYLFYALHLSWSVRAKEDFGDRMAMRFIELFLFQLCGMAVMRQQGVVDIKEIGVSLAAVDRVMAHNHDAIKMLNNYYCSMSEKDDMFFVMSLIA